MATKSTPQSRNAEALARARAGSADRFANMKPIANPIRTVRATPNDTITQAKSDYANASSRGDTAGMLAANQRAEMARSQGGTIGVNQGQQTPARSVNLMNPTAPVPAPMGAPSPMPDGSFWGSGRTKVIPPPVTPPSVEQLGSPAFKIDQMKEKLIVRINRMDPTLTAEEKQMAMDYADDRMVSLQDKNLNPTSGIQSAYDRINEEYKQNIKEQERLRRQKEQELSVSRDGRVQDFMGNLNTVFEPEVQAAREQGNVQKESVRSILSFSGFGRSTTTVEKLTEVDKNVDTRLRAIESQKQAEAMRYQAQLEGADAEVLSGMDREISQLRRQSSQLRLDSMVKIEELKLEAQEKNEQVAMEQLAKLQATLLEDTQGFDLEISKTNGFVTGLDGKPIYDNSGKIQPLPKNFNMGTAITAANGEVSIPVFDEASGTFKMVPTGIREKVSGGGGGGKGGSKMEEVYDPASQKTYLRQLIDNKYTYYNKVTGAKILNKAGTAYEPKVTTKVPGSPSLDGEDPETAFYNAATNALGDLTKGKNKK